MNDIDENELVRQACGGDENAFMMLVASCKETIARVAYFVAGNRDEADDITSEAFLKAWMSLRTKKTEIPFRIWVAKIAKNAAIDRYRKRKPIHFDETGFAIDEPEEILDIRKALMELPLEMRLPVTMMYFDDMSITDIAKVMQIPEGTVKSRIHNAKERMRKGLGND